MRLFIAIKFSTEIEKNLTDLQNEMKKHGIIGNYTNCRNLHLTLAFIGEYDDPGKVMEALNSVSFDSFRLSLDERTGNFGDILWLGIKKNPSLLALDKKVRQSLDEYRIHYDRKPFRPHITLVRKAGKINGINEIKPKAGAMTVEKFSLMQSQRIDGKLVYTELGSIFAKEK